MRKNQKKTSICSISCVMIQQNSANTYFGHFLLENPDTGQKKNFCNSEPNIPNQIYSIKPAKLNATNQFYQTKSRETKYTENQSKVPSKPGLITDNLMSVEPVRNSSRPKSLRSLSTEEEPNMNSYFFKQRKVKIKRIYKDKIAIKNTQIMKWSLNKGGEVAHFCKAQLSPSPTWLRLVLFSAFLAQPSRVLQLSQDLSSRHS